jgi:hypothetical protein
MKKVVIYARVSTASQEYERQLNELREYAERMGYNVAKEFAEKASGAKRVAEREALKELLTFVEESVPSTSIYIKESENVDDHSAPPSEELMGYLRVLAERLYKEKRKDGTPVEKVKEYLKQQSYFNVYQDIIDELHD